jgi:hypothetical protein
MHILLMWLMAVFTYVKTGPFVNGNPPGISQTFLNNMENYMVKVPVISQFGPYSITTTPTFYNHNLVDVNGTPIVPDMIILQGTGAASTSRTAVYEDSTMTTTQVKITGNTSFSVRGIAMKF